MLQSGNPAMSALIGISLKLCFSHCSGACHAPYLIAKVGDCHTLLLSLQEDPPALTRSNSSRYCVFQTLQVMLCCWAIKKGCETASSSLRSQSDLRGTNSCQKQLVSQRDSCSHKTRFVPFESCRESIQNHPTSIACKCEINFCLILLASCTKPQQQAQALPCPPLQGYNGANVQLSGMQIRNKNASFLNYGSSDEEDMYQDMQQACWKPPCTPCWTKRNLQNIFISFHSHSLQHQMVKCPYDELARSSWKILASLNCLNPIARLLCLINPVC